MFPVNKGFASYPVIWRVVSYIILRVIIYNRKPNPPNKRVACQPFCEIGGYINLKAIIFKYLNSGGFPNNPERVFKLSEHLYMGYIRLIEYLNSEHL